MLLNASIFCVEHYNIGLKYKCYNISSMLG